MYLSQLFLNPRSRQVQRDLADAYQLHRTVLHAFPEELPDDERVLFRLEVHPRAGTPSLLVQSFSQPDWSFLAAPEKRYLLPLEQCPDTTERNPAVKQLDLQLRAGQTLFFRLRANPTVKKAREGRRQGRRVGLYREEEQLQWLERKLAASGAGLLSARVANESRLTGENHQDGSRKQLTFLAVQFDGALMVRDPRLLQDAVLNGLGSGKSFGFGLLSLAPPDRTTGNYPASG